MGDSRETKVVGVRPEQGRLEGYEGGRCLSGSTRDGRWSVSASRPGRAPGACLQASERPALCAGCRLDELSGAVGAIGSARRRPIGGRGGVPRRLCGGGRIHRRLEDIPDTCVRSEDFFSRRLCAFGELSRRLGAFG